MFHIIPCNAVKNKGFVFAGIGAAFHILVLIYSKDLGTAFIFLVTYMFLIFIAYKNYWLI